MTVETATHIHELDETKPVASNFIGEDDDHLRLIKTVLKATFPNVGGAVSLTTKQFSDLPETVDKTKSNKESLDISKTAGVAEAQAKKAEVLAYGWDDLDLERDLPHNEVYALFYDMGGAYSLSSDWVKCDGTNGTEDLTSKAIHLLNGDNPQDSSIPVGYFHGLFVVKYVGV